MLAHGQIYPGRRSLFFMEQQLEQNHPDSWKGYTVATSARGDNDPPDSPLKMWRLDDEQIAYPTYEFIMRQRDQLRRHPGFRNICIHKGFSPAPIDQPEWGKPTDIPKASRDWPDLKFIIYHACFGGMTPFLCPQTGLDNIHNKKLRNGEPDIHLAHRVRATCNKLRNVYADRLDLRRYRHHLPDRVRTCWAAAQALGEDKIVFGSDCVYWLAAMADRGSVALPDPGGRAPAVRLSATHRACQAQDPRPQFGAALRAVGRRGSIRAGRLPPGATQLRHTGADEPEDVARVSGADERQAGPGAAPLPDGRRRPEPSALRMGPDRGLET
jgi:hypothetical protein